MLPLYSQQLMIEFMVDNTSLPISTKQLSSSMSSSMSVTMVTKQLSSQKRLDLYDPCHAALVLAQINKLLEIGKLSDVCIKCGVETFTSSQLLLSANSHYFKAMFLNEFGFRSVEDTCCEFLKSMLSVDNHLKLWHFGDERGAAELVGWCDQFIRENILRIFGTQAWLEYPLELVRTVAGSNYLTIYNESQLFEGLITWVKHDPHIRLQFLTELFACIRLDVISLKYLYHVISEEKLLMENKECSALINLVKDTRTLPLSLSPSPPESKSTRDIGCGGSLFIMGGLGSDREPSRMFQRFSLRDMSWQSIMSFPDAMWGGAGVVVEGYLLMSGGEGTETRNNLTICNPAMLEENDGREVIWDALSPMTIARFGHGMVECMGWAYVVAAVIKS
ncbi:kelch-like protein 30 [Bolinopsis microptera]|uniref:kelch-like protein 30 n=1 Tax=Bolinopsis microptera TaxID=2820187 RepID=UPI0030792A50